jgi:hypothetical protein
MKAKHFFTVTALLLGLLIALLAVTNFDPPVALARDKTASHALNQQATPAAQEGGDSEIGSTDGILVMGVVIVLIVTLPLVFHKKR